MLAASMIYLRCSTVLDYVEVLLEHHATANLYGHYVMRNDKLHKMEK